MCLFAKQKLVFFWSPLENDSFITCDDVSFGLIFVTNVKYIKGEEMSVVLLAQLHLFGCKDMNKVPTYQLTLTVLRLTSRKRFLEISMSYCWIWMT